MAITLALTVPALIAYIARCERSQPRNTTAAAGSSVSRPLAVIWSTLTRTR